MNSFAPGDGRSYTNNPLLQIHIANDRGETSTKLHCDSSQIL